MSSKYYNLCEIQTFILSEVHGEERKLLLRQQMVLHCDREREPMERELGMLKNIYDRFKPIKNKSTHHLRSRGQDCLLVC